MGYDPFLDPFLIVEDVLPTCTPHGVSMCNFDSCRLLRLAKRYHTRLYVLGLSNEEGRRKSMFSGEHAESSATIGHYLRSFLSFVGMVVLVIAMAWAMRTFIFGAYEIPSGSMETTIMTDDRVFAEKISYYFGDPEQGDIVTFEDPEVAGRTLIKRIIAVGGQTVDLIDGAVYVDGVKLDEPYTNGLPSDPLLPAFGVDIEYPYTVPDGCLWVMGDNRTKSSDSRYFGAVPVSSVTGKAVFTYWPIANLGLLE